MHISIQNTPTIDIQILTLRCARVHVALDVNRSTVMISSSDSLCAFAMCLHSVSLLKTKTKQHP